MLAQIFSLCGEENKFHPILQNPGRLDRIVKILRFCIWDIYVLLVVTRVVWLQGKVLDVLFLQVNKVAVIEVAVISIKDKYLIVGRVFAEDSGELGPGFKPPVSIHIPIWCGGLSNLVGC